MNNGTFKVKLRLPKRTQDPGSTTDTSKHSKKRKTEHDHPDSSLQFSLNAGRAVAPYKKSKKISSKESKRERKDADSPGVVQHSSFANGGVSGIRFNSKDECRHAAPLGPSPEVSKSSTKLRIPQDKVGHHNHYERLKDRRGDRHDAQQVSVVGRKEGRVEKMSGKLAREKRAKEVARDKVRSGKVAESGRSFRGDGPTISGQLSGSSAVGAVAGGGVQKTGNRIKKVGNDKALLGTVVGEMDPTPKREDFERIIDHVQKQDKSEIFKDPVTEEVAPGYFDVITTPMDFSTMRAKLEGGSYTTWESLEKDMMVIFTNAMTYNSPNTLYHKQANTLMQVAKKLIDLGKQGVTNFRGKTAGVVRAHNAQLAADERAEKNAQKAALRAQRMQMKNDKLIQKAAARGIRVPFGPSTTSLTLAQDGQDPKLTARAAQRETDGRRPLPSDENIRWTYQSPVPPNNPLKPWGGLANGANGEGVPYAAGRLVVSPASVGSLPANVYLQSVVRFAKRLEGRARDYVMMRAASSMQDGMDGF